MPEVKNDLILVLEQIEKEKGIKKQEILKVIEDAVVSAYRKQIDKNVNIEASLDPETIEVKARVVKKIVEKVTNPYTEISLEEAKKINQDAIIGSELKFPVSTEEFSRIAAQTAKQVIIQKIRESERQSVYEEFKSKEGTVVTGTVFRFAGENIIVDLGKAEGIIPLREQSRTERFRVGEHLKVLIVAVEKSSKGPKILLSRNRPELVKKLFDMEVPEIYEKVVEIVQVVRQHGARSKVVVRTNNPRVDPVGACVGMRGSRIKPIIDELRGERIDLILFSDDIKTFIANAFSPAKVLSVNIINMEEKKAEVIVSDDMLSLAIGKDGANVNLVCRLTGWQIDVRSETQKRQEQEQKVTHTIEEISKLPGIGKKLAEVLFKSGFNEIKKIASAKIEDLTALQGIGKRTAVKILKSANEYLSKADGNLSKNESEERTEERN
ncbi:MAG: transcription termination factor NusA [Elusimicrobiota bacterium]|nr:transcription termination factor NusA [Elusimicrobiota bacterium]